MATPHEPKQDRSRATRQRLLEATIDCLAETGWAAATVSVVAERAGVSRGAAQHHFPTREELITAALEFMFEFRMDMAKAEAETVNAVAQGEGRTRAVVSALVESYTTPFFKAALQVWTHAAADPALRERILPSRPASAGPPTAAPSRRSASTTPTRSPTTWSRPPSTSPAASASPTSSPTTPPAAN